MKKNFFKKLSFVLALAMIVSLVAPVTGALAATTYKLSASSKTLLLGSDDRNEYDFNLVGTKGKGWKLGYVSSNTKVATVEKESGLTTAVGIGKTTIGLWIKDSKGKVLYSPTTLKATVEVKSNIAELTDIYLQSPKDADLTALEVGKDYDFGRKFVTQSGSTTATTAITRWEVGEGATINDAGVFKATESGDYTIVARAFQSKAKYTEWLSSKDSSLVLASKELKVTVGYSIESIKQVDADTFQVTFGSDVSSSDVKTASVLYRVVNGKDVSTGAEKIKSVTLDATGKVATIDVYATFTAGADYRYAFGELTGSFKAATKSIDEIVSLSFSNTNATIGVGLDMLGSIKALNKDGVVIYTGSEIAGYLQFTYGGDQTKGNISSNYAYIYAEGYAAPVTVKFSHYIYDEATKEYKNIVAEATAMITGIVGGAVNTSTLQFELTDLSGTAVRTDSNWTGNLTVPAGESGYIHVRYYTSSNSSSYTYKSDVASGLPFTYETSDSSKLLIQPGSNIFTPVSAGVVTVLVKQGTTTVATFDVTIVAARTFGTITQDTGAITIGNNANVGEEKHVTLTVADSLGKAFTPAAGSVVIEYVNRPNSLATLNIQPHLSSGKIDLEVNGRGRDAGIYHVKAKVTAFGVTKEVFFTVQVIEANTPATTVISGWKVETENLSDITVDLKGVYDKDIVVNVYGYNSSNVRVAELHVGTEYTISVKNSSGTEVASGSNVLEVVTGAANAKSNTWATGTYTATIFLTQTGIDNYFAGSGRQPGAYFGAVVVTLTDTTALDKKIQTTSVSGGNILAIAKESITVTLNGSDLDDSNIYGVKYVVGSGESTDTTASFTASGVDIFIKEVTVRVNDPDGLLGYREYTVTVNLPVRVR